jgi:hypothetical protein
MIIMRIITMALVVLVFGYIFATIITQDNHKQ